MARKPISSVRPTQTPGATTTPVRGTPIPRPQAAPRREITQEMIAKRAYEIHLSGQGGSELDNWLRAERELRGQA